MRIGLAGAGRIGARHARTLRTLPAVQTLVVADADPARARSLRDRAAGAGGADVVAVDSVDALFRAGLDGLVVAAATDAHAELVLRAARARLPVFCEKPLAADLDGTVQVVAATRDVPVQVGFQRRFDAGHLAARAAVADGRLGWLHTMRSCTFDPAPPPREYVPGSGGLFRDCGVHDFDAIRFVSGREIVRVVAVGANRGDGFFREYGDVDTATAVLTLDDDTIATVSATRYNAAGYDVRLEVFGSRDSIVAGLDEHTPLTPVGPGRIPAPAAPYRGFMERFAAAYDAELSAFVDVVAGRREPPCLPEQALEAFYVAEACEVSRHEGRPVAVAEIRERTTVR
ncbi:myo-inositol 2-dehydrogenase / D-chiro-inositol 1-dehydrogenase [Thermomonospora echinospora]|uniref:Myo-inositol 2-dehydrogenase / D-chiro-inositol 1-dehydrogenase n=1 Tax=Thermomonospora echinospora TaxID=1992 RepID=A0A1H5X538_9ACTN|nr:Gfo/Idh/MocA family oxidoreductase [Thermomonospora echinospora]SEG06882.1 myo-inositol 2-dehydrogenase / D-chiro-inositol 1-dehydrogenase [Thermomonospora echinospora]